MQANNNVRSSGNHICSHCQCSTVLMGSKSFSDYLNLGGPDIGSDLHLKPTIFEAITLIFGFRMPPPELLINGTANGVQYFDARRMCHQNLSICINCESVLTNLYKVFLLFTELSNGRESFILKNSIISGRMNKEQEVIPLGSFNAANAFRDKSVTITPYTPTSVGLSIMQSSINTNLSTIRRELSSDVVAEMYVPNQPPTFAAPINGEATTVHKSRSKPSDLTPIVTSVKSIAPRNSTKASNPQSQSTNPKENKKPKPVEVITLEEDDSPPRSSTPTTATTSSSTQRTSVPNNKNRLNQRFVPYQTSTPIKSGIIKTGNTFTPGGGVRRPPMMRPVMPSPAATIITTTASSSSAHSHLGARPNYVSGVKDPSSVSVLSQRKGLVTTVTTTTAKHKCDACPLFFPSLVDLLTHAYMDHGKGKGVSKNAFACPECPKTFISSVSLSAHLRHHKKEKECPSPAVCKVPGCGQGCQGRGHDPSAGQVADRMGIQQNGNARKDDPVESESDYWTSGIQILHDPDQVMKKLEATILEERLKKNGATQ